jgi:toxin ParE1/3/4
MHRHDVVLTPRAFSDLENIRDFLVSRNPIGAENVRLAINATLDQLSYFPLTGRNRARLRVRSISVARFPYTIYYRLQDDRIVVIHVRDDRRAPLKAGDV